LGRSPLRPEARPGPPAVRIVAETGESARGRPQVPAERIS
jgi:hypothetical protein